MDTITVAERPHARRPSAGRSACTAGSAPAATPRAGFSFIELNDGSCLGNVQVVADGELPNYESRGQAPARRRQRRRRRRSQGVAGQGAGDRGARRQASNVHRRRRPPRRTRCRRRGTRSSSSATIAHLRPRTNTFGAVARVRNQRLPKSIHDFFQEHGFLYIHTPIITASDCEGAGRDVPRHHARPGKPPPKADGQDRLRAGLLRQAGVPHRQRPARRSRSFACSLGKVYTFGPTFRAENSQHPAAPRRVLDGRAGDGLLRPDRQHGPGRGVPQADLQRRAGALRRGHGVLQRARSTRTCSTRWRTSSTTPFVRLPYTEAVEILQKSGQDVRVPGRLGHRPAERSTSAT